MFLNGTDFVEYHPIKTYTMRLLIILFLLTNLQTFAQTKNDTLLAYKKKSLNEKNIIRINYDEQYREDYQFLINEKELKRDIITFFTPYLPLTSLSKLPLEVVKHSGEYYFLFKTEVQTIISKAHLVYIPRVNIKFLILGNNHCIIPVDTPLCYPNSDGLTCVNKQKHCSKINSKK